MRHSSFFLKFIILIAFMINLNGCGEDEIFTAPYGSVITVEPESYDVADGNLAINWSDAYFKITVLDPSGQPKNNIELFIDFPWSSPDFYAYVQLYESDIDSGTYNPVNAPMKVVTDESGNYFLRVDFAHGGGLEYTGDIQIISAGAEQGFIEFTVTAP